jgi:hypothetical protein
LLTLFPFALAQVVDSVFVGDALFYLFEGVAFSFVLTLDNSDGMRAVSVLVEVGFVNVMAR